MALKPNGKVWTIQEQIVEDPASGLTLQFEVKEGSDAPFRLRILGDLPFGNREILFDRAGNETGSGTSLAGPCRATWLSPVKD